MNERDFKEKHIYEIHGEGLFVFTHKSKGYLWFDTIIDYTGDPYTTLGIPDRNICNEKIREIDKLELVGRLL